MLQGNSRRPYTGYKNLLNRCRIRNEQFTGSATLNAYQKKLNQDMQRRLSPGKNARPKLRRHYLQHGIFHTDIQSSQHGNWDLLPVQCPLGGYQSRVYSLPMVTILSRAILDIHAPTRAISPERTKHTTPP